MATIITRTGDVAGFVAPTGRAPRPPRHYPANHPAGTYAANANSSAILPSQAPISSSYNVPPQLQPTTSFQANPELQGYGNSGDLSAPIARGCFSSPFADQPVFARQVFLPSRPQMNPAMMPYYHQQPAGVGVAMERSHPYLQSGDPVHAAPVAAVPNAAPLELAKIARGGGASPRESVAAATSIIATSYLAIPDALPKEPTMNARRGRGRGRVSPRESAAAVTSITTTSYLAIPDALPKEPTINARRGRGRGRASPRESAATATSYLAIPDALPKEPTKNARRGRGRGRARGATASRQTAPREQPAPPSHQELPPQQPAIPPPAIIPQHDDHMQEDSGSKNLKEEAAAGGGGAGAAELQVFPYADTSTIGVVFSPTEEELIAFIRLKYQYGQFADDIFKEFDVSKANPYTLQDNFGKSIDGSWYFFSPLYRRYDGGSRQARGIAETEGYWKSTAKEKDIVDGGGNLIGKMNTLSFCRGKGVTTPWRMKEYRILSPDDSYTLDAWALYILYLRDDHTKADARNAGNTHENASNANGDGENLDVSVDDYTMWDMDLAPAYKDLLS
ncbi:hypothetical protein GUJ93_ZPchr0013g34693 [Zizania palustris]|uniref:NAC domain-containing protein n=1 Tax=Zizania palustris TaxID=103762 RepID=A0A8J5WW49_ZIZPA|nr:hypothetical protein GUJ93_ZPchr0013g34693 [Zizania palustris]